VARGAFTAALAGEAEPSVWLFSSSFEPPMAGSSMPCLETQHNL